MKYELLVNRLKEMLRQKFPHETNQARLLSELLGIKENSVYRKFKGERHFSLEEMDTIARTFSVPIDTLLAEEPPDFSHQLELILTREMSEEERTIYLEKTTRSVFAQAAKAGYSKFMGVCKNIPVISYCYFDRLMEFALLKWHYFNNNFKEILPLTQMRPPEEFIEMKETYTEAFTSFRRLVFIVDGDMIRNYTLELRFFQKIGYLTTEDINLLLDDLENLLRTIEEICRKGYGENPRQEIAVFYSDIPLYNDIYLVESTCVNHGIFFTQGFLPIIQKQPHTFKVFRDWVDSCIRSSNPICGVADLDRQAFLRNSTAWWKIYGIVYLSKV